MSNFVFVAGSAHLDLLARVVGRDSVVDKIGDVSIEVGGSAANIATNMACLGFPVRFLTAMNRSPFSSVVLSYLQTNGVEPCVVFDDELPVAAFSAHIDHGGEMISAISSTPIDRVAFDEHYLRRCMQGARAAIVDCNLSVTTLDIIAELAHRFRIPCYCAAVSEPKSVRMADVSTRFSGVFLNRQEAQYLMKSRLVECETYEELAGQLNTTLFVTRDQDGVAVVDADGFAAVRPATLSQARGNKLGLGDAFMSAVICYTLRDGLSPIQASEAALAYVQTLADKHNCNAGPEGAVVSILERLDRQAHHDSLTGLYNRQASESLLLRAANDASQRQGELSVILLDIDHFKSINDTYGHAAGDQVLAAVSKILQKAVRDHDSTGRWGGEEFICILPDADLEVARMVAERICIDVRRQVTTPTTVTVSCGVAMHRLNEAFADVVERADRALYLAKNSGRNRVATESALEETPASGLSV